MKHLDINSTIKEIFQVKDEGLENMRGFRSCSRNGCSLWALPASGTLGSNWWAGVVTSVNEFDWLNQDMFNHAGKPQNVESKTCQRKDNKRKMSQERKRSVALILASVSISRVDPCSLRSPCGACWPYISTSSPRIKCLCWLLTVWLAESVLRKGGGQNRFPM